MSIRGGGLPEKHEVSQVFGYVTDEDRERWDRARAKNTREAGTAKHMMKSSAAVAYQLASYGIQAQLNAETQVAARDRNNQNRTKVRTITETVDYQPRDDRHRLDEGPEFC